MDEKELKIARLKASIERHKAYMIYWQTKILSGNDKSQSALNSLYAHVKFIDDCAEMILEIK
ncbi:hypothetical protein LCGC14_2431190 [marine sediment metagenome]|uniref:Uncharacterized protein n=1 Tax=marine sediment metagenome TaxID=412755 RepID=A0A0F9DYV4_9ZZZZ